MIILINISITTSTKENIPWQFFCFHMNYLQIVFSVIFVYLCLRYWGSRWGWSFFFLSLLVRWEYFVPNWPLMKLFINEINKSFTFLCLCFLCFCIWSGLQLAPAWCSISCLWGQGFVVNTCCICCDLQMPCLGWKLHTNDMI